jgi:hypothetical protein
LLGIDLTVRLEEPDPAPSMPAEHPPKPSIAWAVLVVTSCLLMAQGLAVLDVNGRELVDTDGYMRTVRAVELADGSSGWFDGSASRSNAPFGHEMHWTRPMDAVLVAAGSPWVLGGWEARDAVYRGSVAVGPVLLIALALAVTWAAIPLMGRRWAPLAGAIAIAQPALAAYTSPGRSDHHALILLAAAVVAGGTLRLLAGGRGRVGVVAGVALGLGLWVSVESLFVVGVVGLVLGTAWVAGRVDRRRVMALWWSAAITTAVAWGLERGPDVLSVEYDRISVAHVALMGAIALAWLMATFVTGGWASRLGAATLAAGVWIGIVIVVFPGFLEGPFGAVPAELQTRWLDRVVELQPLLTRPPTQVLALLAVPVAGLVLALWRLRRREPRWALVAVWLITGIGLALAQTRWIMYPQLVAGIPVAAAGGWALDRVANRGMAIRLASTVAIVIAVVFGWRVLAALPPNGDGPTSEPCSVVALAPLLREGVVLAAIDQGPEILWRADATVVASPYHRNVEGILDTLDAFEGDERASRRIVDERGVDLVAVCPTVDGKDYPNAGPDSLFTRLVTDDPPPWLYQTARPEDAGGFLVFGVVG